MIQTFFPRHFSSPVFLLFSPYAIRSHKNDSLLRFLLFPYPIRFYSKSRTAASQRHIRLSYPAAILIQGTAARLDVLHGVTEVVTALPAQLCPAFGAAVVGRRCATVMTAAHVRFAAHLRRSDAQTASPLWKPMKGRAVMAHVLPYRGR